MLLKGDYVSTYWLDAYGLTIVADGRETSGFTPNGAARIFNTSDPGIDSLSLGTPNGNCVPGGPGVAIPVDVGIANATNCEPLGNVLIIQETNTTEPFENSNGGSITFSFDPPVYQVDLVGLMDIRPVSMLTTDPLDTISVTQYDDSRLDITYEGLGDNTVQNISTAGSLFVKEVAVNFHQSGAVTLLAFQHCPDHRPPSIETEGSPANDSSFTTASGTTKAPAEDEQAHSAPIPSVAEKKFVKEMQCSEGFWGERNVEIEESDGETVTFRLTMPFATALNKVGIWFNNPNQAQSEHQCQLLDEMPCGTFDESFTAKCTNGYTSVNIYGGGTSFKYNQIGVESEVPEANCPSHVSFPDYNPLKRCFWEFKLRCEAPSPPHRNLEVSMPLTEQESRKSCEEESKLEDVQLIKDEKCTDALNAEPPIKIESQDGNTVTFTISQVWKGCAENSETETLGWMATDFEAQGNKLQCLKKEGLECGSVSTLTAACTDGVTVVDLYANDETIWQGSTALVPSACDGSAGIHNTCHFRYLLKCFPSKCTSTQTARRLGGYGRSRSWFDIY